MIDTSILKNIKNPSDGYYKITHYIPEITFEGDDEKPDFGTLIIEYEPNDILIELKSLKYYFYQYRNKRFSYEGFIDKVYKDLFNVYVPIALKLTLETKPRGGISSKVEMGGV